MNNLGRKFESNTILAITSKFTRQKMGKRKNDYTDVSLADSCFINIQPSAIDDYLILVYLSAVSYTVVI